MHWAMSFKVSAPKKLFDLEYPTPNWRLVETWIGWRPDYISNALHRPIWLLIFAVLTSTASLLGQDVPSVGSSGCVHFPGDQNCGGTVDHSESTPRSERSFIGDADAAFAEGNARMRESDYQGAIDAYRRAIHLSYFTIWQGSAHKLRTYVRPRLKQAEEAFKAQRDGKTSTYHAIPTTDIQNQSSVDAHDQAEKHQDALIASQIRQELGQFAKMLSSSTPVDVGLNFAGPQNRNETRLDFVGAPPRTDKTAPPGLTFMNSAVIAQREEQKRKEEDLVIARKYSALQVPPVPQL